MISKYFDHTTDTNTQGLVQSLVTESIQQRGIDVVYILRDDFSPDFLFGESHSITKFEKSIPIEMLIKDYGGGGHNDILEKFGLVLEDTLNLQVAIDRFEVEGIKLDLTRPEIGDLIYIPFIHSVFEIKNAFLVTKTHYTKGVLIIFIHLN